MTQRESLEKFLSSKKWLDITSVKVGVSMSMQTLNPVKMAECAWQAAQSALIADIVEKLEAEKEGVSLYAQPFCDGIDKAIEIVKKAGK